MCRHCSLVFLTARRGLQAAHGGGGLMLILDVST
jgi:hypothetical protein